jgi:signal transduction histidine kinase
VGVLMMAVGCTWLLAPLLEFSDGGRLAVSAGAVGAWFWAALLAHLLLAFPSGRLGRWQERVVVACAYLIATVWQWTWVVFVDAAIFYRSGCDGCPLPWPSLGHHHALAKTLIVGQRAAGAIVALAVCGLLVRHWRLGSLAQRRALTPVITVGALAAVLLAANVGTLATEQRALGKALAWPYEATVVIMPFAFLGGLLHTRLGRAVGVARLVDELDALPSAASLAAALARALGDDSLGIIYWLAPAAHYVDADGHPVAFPGEFSGRAVTPVKLDGRHVAALVHDPSLCEEQGLVLAAGQTAVLWLERGRLEAERNAQIIELQESRARIVQAGDAERRRIERALHDGAQQRLAALLLQAKLRRRALSHQDQPTEALIKYIERGLTDALNGLRAIAAGILPAVLSDHGLHAAIDELISHSPVPIVVEAMPVERLAPELESTAYFVIAEALTNVLKHADASRVLVRIRRQDGLVTIEVADDGIGGAAIDGGSGIRGLADRVGALGGKLTCHSPVGQGTLLHAEIPCES